MSTIPFATLQKMKQALRYLLLSGCLCGFGQAAVINFSGTLTAASGIFTSFPGLAVNDPFYGSVDITSVGSDNDPVIDRGVFPVLVGQLNLFTPGLGALSYDASFAAIRVATVHQVAGDSLSIRAYFLTEYVEVFLNGNNGFLNNDSYPIGNGGINWSQFTGGSAVYQSSLLLTNSMASVLEGDSVDFTIDQASEVPEPGTLLLAPAGALALYLRRRIQVR